MALLGLLLVFLFVFGTLFRNLAGTFRHGDSTNNSLIIVSLTFRLTGWDLEVRLGVFFALLLFLFSFLLGFLLGLFSSFLESLDFFFRQILEFKFLTKLRIVEIPVLTINRIEFNELVVLVFAR